MDLMKPYLSTHDKRKKFVLNSRMNHAASIFCRSASEHIVISRCDEAIFPQRSYSQTLALTLRRTRQAVFYFLKSYKR